MFPGTTVDGSVNGATASLAFNNCQIQASDGTTVTINGTVTDSSIAAQLTAVVAILGGSDTFSSQGSGQVSGSLQLSADSTGMSCQVAASDTFQSSGNFSTSPVTENGTITNFLSGTLCGLSVSNQTTIPL